MRTMKKLNTLILTAGVLASLSAHAQLRVEITGVGSNQIPVAVAAFGDESVSPTQISKIIKTDLERSGAFKIIDAGTIADTNNVDLPRGRRKAPTRSSSVPCKRPPTAVSRCATS